MAARKNQTSNRNMLEFSECIAQAREVLKNEKMMDMQSHILSVAQAPFRERMIARRSKRGG